MSGGLVLVDDPFLLRDIQFHGHLRAIAAPHRRVEPGKKELPDDGEAWSQADDQSGEGDDQEAHQVLRPPGQEAGQQPTRRTGHASDRSGEGREEDLPVRPPPRPTVRQATVIEYGVARPSTEDKILGFVREYLGGGRDGV